MEMDTPTQTAETAPIENSIPCQCGTWDEPGDRVHGLCGLCEVPICTTCEQQCPGCKEWFCWRCLSDFEWSPPDDIGCCQDCEHLFYDYCSACEHRKEKGTCATCIVCDDSFCESHQKEDKVHGWGGNKHTFESETEEEIFLEEGV